MLAIKKYLSLVGWHTIVYPPNTPHFGLPAFINSTVIIKLFILVILCMIFARSAAMAFNRWLDAKYDAMNPRTAIREIPAGIIKPTNALLFTVANCLLFIITLFVPIVKLKLQ